MAKYVFRLDDIAPNMHWENYSRLRDVFDRNGVKPLIGVVPENSDPRLLRYPEVPVDFWGEIRTRQSSGWEVALHGYRHELVSCSGGILRIQPAGEFAGLPHDAQLSKISAGLDIFRREGISTRTFIAPAHCFDDATLHAIREAGLSWISDGYSLFPYRRHGIVHVPQMFERPREMPFGIWTFCLHPNSLSAELMTRVSQFVERNRQDIVTFADVAQNVGTWLNQVGENVLLLGVRSCRSALSSLRRFRN